jgi:hypothetical protein
MKVNKKGNNSKIIVFTETRHLIFVPINVLSESDTYLFYSTAINIDKKQSWRRPFSMRQFIWQTIVVVLKSEVMCI